MTKANGPADPLLSIGVFSRRSRLSPKALRLYDRKGVLVPADVDPDTGYRRYRESQLGIARLVVMLRRLNVPLMQVAEIVTAPGAIGAELLSAYWESVERKLASQRELHAHITSRLLGEEGRMVWPDVKERDVAEQRHVDQRHRLGLGRLGRGLACAHEQQHDASRSPHPPRSTPRSPR